MFKDQPLANKKTMVRGMVERMARAYGVNKKDLPLLLQCNRNVMNNWVYYARVPLEQLDICRQQTGASMEWLMYGNNDDPQQTTQQSEQLKNIIDKVLHLGAEVELITANSPDAVELLSNKLTKDIIADFALSAKPQKSA